MSFKFKSETDHGQSGVKTSFLGIGGSSVAKASSRVSNSQASPKIKTRNHKPKFLRNLKLFGFTALFLTGAAGGLGLFGVNAASKGLDQEIERIHALGGFTSMADLKKATQVPPDQNAARALSGAQSILEMEQRSLKDLNLKEPDPGLEDKILEGKASADEISTANRVLVQEKDGLEAYKQASNFPHVSFQRDYSNLAMTSLQEYSPLKKSARLLALRAALSAKGGDLKSAKDDLEAAGRLAKLLEDDPPFIGGLVQTSVQSIVLRITSEIYERNWKNPEATALAEGVLKAVGKPTNVGKMLRFEPLYLIQLPQMIADAPREADGNNSPLASKIFAFPGVATAIQTAALRNDRIQMELADKYGDDYAKLIDALKTLETANAQGGFMNRIVDSLSATYSGAPTALAGVEAMRRCLTQAIAAAEFHCLHNAWPQELPSPGKDATDPFTDNPLRLSVKPNLFKAWSVGNDRIDDNGVHSNIRTSTGEHTPDDVGIELKN